MIVPDNKIAIIPTIEDNNIEPFYYEEIFDFITPLNDVKKRDWFGKDFYKCLPLTIGNTQGFLISVPFDFECLWNGGNRPEDLYLRSYNDDFKNKNYINVESHFGYGILTINLPIIFKTPPEINLMTIAPPNFPTPGLSPMTGVVECDNLRYVFTLNIKIDISNAIIKVVKHSPLVGILPIPRNFCDNFEIINAYDIFDKKDIEEERVIAKENSIVDQYLRSGNYKKWWDESYFDGMDIRGNKFKNKHQTIFEHKKIKKGENNNE